MQPRLVLGTMNFGGTFNGLVVFPSDETESAVWLETAVRLGFDYFDTAPIYTKGRAETLLGRYLTNKSKIYTKVGVDINHLSPKLDFTFSGLKASIEGSLKRLNRSTVEGIFIHNPSKEALVRKDVYQFAQWVKEQAITSNVGVALLDTSLISVISEPALIDMVSVEVIHAEDAPAEMTKMGRWQKLFLRSPFEGGRKLKSVEGKQVRDVIRERLVEISTSFLPYSIIIGPRTVTQMTDYESIAWPASSSSTAGVAQC